MLFLRNLDKYEPSCKLLDVDCELASFDPTGVLVDSKSHLVLGGRLARATINASTRESLKRHKNTNNLTLDKVRQHPHFCRLWTDYDWDDILEPSPEPIILFRLAPTNPLMIHARQRQRKRFGSESSFYYGGLSHHLSAWHMHFSFSIPPLASTTITRTATGVTAWRRYRRRERAVNNGLPKPKKWLSKPMLRSSNCVLTFPYCGYTLFYLGCHNIFGNSSRRAKKRFICDSNLDVGTKIHVRRNSITNSFPCHPQCTTSNKKHILLGKRECELNFSDGNIMPPSCNL